MLLAGLLFGPLVQTISYACIVWNFNWKSEVRKRNCAVF